MHNIHAAIRNHVQSQTNTSSGSTTNSVEFVPPGCPASAAFIAAAEAEESGSTPSGSGQSAPSPPQLEDDDEDLAHIELAEHLRRLDIGTNTTKSKRFFGSSSSLMLIKNAMDAKDSYTGSDPTKPYANRGKYWTIHPVS